MTSISAIHQLQTFSQLLASRMRKQDFLTYFQKLSLVSQEDGVVTIGVVSEFIRDNMSFRFAEVLLAAASEVWTGAQKVEIIVDNQIDNPTYSQVIDCRKIFKNLQSKEKPEVIKESGKEDFSSRFDLEHFVV